MNLRHTRNLLNTNIAVFEGAGKYEIPMLNGVPVEEYTQTNFIAFSDVLAQKKRDGNDGVHFYIDDYRFERVWSQPLKYLDILSKYKFVLSPDFSMYTDEPMALQIFSHYKKHWFGALMESVGIRVIPTICWADERSFEWCFDGEPHESVVSVASLGVFRDKEAVRLFNEGYKAMLDALEPKLVLFFGKDVLSPENKAATQLEFHKGFSQVLVDRRNAGEFIRREQDVHLSGSREN